MQDMGMCYTGYDFRCSERRYEGSWCEGDEC